MSRGMINIFYDEHNLKEELKKEVTLVSFDSKGSKDLSMFTDSILQFNPQYVIIDFPLERDEALKFSDEGRVIFFAQDEVTEDFLKVFGNTELQ